MNRKDFLQRTLGMGCCAFVAFDSVDVLASSPADDQSEKFVQNWLWDLLDTIESELPREQQVRLIEGCGRGCVRRHQFKQDIIQAGKGDVDKLIEAQKKNFEIWREGDDLIHIRFGEVSPGCYCPAARYRPAKPNDLHCECSRMSNQAIWEQALGRPLRVDILESVRRGQKTCHFLLHLA